MSAPTVLLVEDEPAQREVLAYNLAAEGFAVTQASNGEEAIVNLLAVTTASSRKMPLLSGTPRRIDWRSPCFPVKLRYSRSQRKRHRFA